ncbi:MAG TPA: DUF1772 domain-containing protein [Lapillicoccus sp.]|nr:DUF1772 domain-containing protein [Lapillicoccus sp.]
MSTAVLLLATLTSGLVAGVYLFYAHTVMPGLGRAGDRTFVAGFQALDRAIVNPWFMATGFLGAPVLSVVAGLLHLDEPLRPVLWWVVAALVLDLVTIGITAGVNLPANDRLKAAGDADTIDVAAVRTEFDEVRWVRWNLVRVVLSVASFVALAWALVLAGRAAS